MSSTPRTATKSSRKSTVAPKTKPPARAKGAKASKGDGKEALWARVEAVRMAQLQEGNFDCFATANAGHCDQDGCLYRSDCLSFAKKMA